MMLAHRIRISCAAFLIALLAAFALGAPASAGTKRLRFVGQPASARVGQTITTTPYNVPPGGPVTVEVVDGNGHRVTTSNALVALTLAPVSGTGVLSGTTQVAAVHGLATFNDLKIIAQGSYRLVASSHGLASATSGTFRIDEAATVCAENAATCTASLSNATTTLNVTAPPTPHADAGVLVINRNIGAALDCAGYTELSQGDFAVEFLRDPGSAGRAKVVTATITAAAMNQLPHGDPAFLDMCFGASFSFTNKFGHQAAFDASLQLFVDRLPNCGASPCVSMRGKTHDGQGFIEVQAPGGDQDPRYGP